MSADTRRAPFSETIRLGALLMLQQAVELEVTEFLGRDHYQRSADGLLRGYRNGYTKTSWCRLRKPLGWVAALWPVAGTVFLRQGRPPPTSAFNSGLDR